MSELTDAGVGESPRLTLFRVRPGCRFGAFSEYGPGDVVELPDYVLAAFGDKLDPVSKSETVTEPGGQDAVETKTRRRAKS